MSDDVKTPKAGEWWRSRCGEIRYVICDLRKIRPDHDDPFPTLSIDNVSDSESTISHMEDGREDSIDSDNDLVEHLPLCDSFTWKPAAPIDPGEGFELLPVGTLLEDGDEFSIDGGKTWVLTGNGGRDNVRANTYRRRKPAETWPQYWTTTDSHNGSTAYVRRIDAERYVCVRKDSSDCASTWAWSSAEERERDRLTPVEAAALLTAVPELCQMCCEPAIPGTGGCGECTQYAIESTGCPVETWPKYYVVTNWCFTAYWCRYEDNRLSIMSKKGDVRSWVTWSASDDDLVKRGAIREVTKAEAEARVKPPESPDDWVTQDRVPARPGIDQRRYVYFNISSGCSIWEDCAGMSWRPVHGTQINSATIELRCRRRDMPAPELTPFQKKMKAIGERESEMKAQQSKRIPIRLWIMNDVIYSKTRWTVTAAQSDVETSGNMVEIKIGPDGFYVEGEP